MTDRLPYPFSNPENRERAIALWKEDWSLQMIAKEFSVSRMGVKKMLNRNGVDTGKGRVFTSYCLFCGREFRLSRKQKRDGERTHCSRKCYFAMVSNRCGRYSLKGLIRGRTVIGAYCPMMPGYVVHHIDGDQENNFVWNLMVFKSPEDHIRYHRITNCRPNPVFDGSKIKD